MIYLVDIPLEEFEFWSGACDTAEMLNHEDFDIIESNLEDCFNDTPTQTEINDFFWFDRDTIADWLGYYDWEDLEIKRSHD